MRAPLHVLLLLTVAGVVPAAAQGNGAGRTTGQASGSIELDSTARADSARPGFDMSHYLLKQKGFLPIPIIITEKAVGYGGGLAALWFGTPPIPPPGEEDKFQTPPVTGAAAFYAGESYGVGAGVYRPINGDRIRYFGMALGTSLGLKFYGFDPDAPIADDPLLYTFKLVGTEQRLQYRLRDTPFYVGAHYQFASTSSEFDFGFVSPIGVGDRDLDYTVSGAGLSAEFDTRDNFLDAKRGQVVSANATWFGPALGGTTSFGKFKTAALLYEQPTTQWGYGVRFDLRTAWGDVPFFEVPYVSLRGITKQQFSNDVVLMQENEVRYTVATRWTVLAFGGAGYSAPAWHRLDDGHASFAGGAGFRYLLATRLGLGTGIDLAMGTGGDSPSIYFQIGSAWR
jgi:Omp85 superfamily domain